MSRLDDADGSLLLARYLLGEGTLAEVLLREVFQMPFDEIAEAIGKPSATARQIARRAGMWRRGGRGYG